ncbi:MAG: hypothetical protein HY690_17435, partial [Chloroflexi bacterium]|nr:hypothetical protein [Chloroflexota bacterium]
LAGKGAGGLGPVLLTWFLATFGLLILLGTEFIFIYDSFGSRMNTVFKFHYHAWLLLGLASALTLAILWQRPGARRLGRPLAVGVAVGLLGLGAVYPAAATYEKSGKFGIPPTLDGARFLAQGRSADWQAITWLQSQAGRPVVLEAVGPDYQEFARVSTFSGLPTVLGWVGHELQWRGRGEDLATRERDVEAIYRTGDEGMIKRLLDRYQVDYVFVGSLERTKYGPGVDARFARLLEPAYQADGVTVYRVPRQLQESRGAR